MSGRRILGLIPALTMAALCGLGKILLGVWSPWGVQNGSTGLPALSGFALVLLHFSFGGLENLEGFSPAWLLLMTRTRNGFFFGWSRWARSTSLKATARLHAQRWFPQQGTEQSPACPPCAHCHCPARVLGELCPVPPAKMALSQPPMQPPKQISCKTLRQNSSYTPRAAHC